MDVTRKTTFEELRDNEMLSIRICNVLIRQGFKIIGDVLKLNIYELALLPNMGKRCANILAEFLEDNNFHLKTKITIRRIQ